MRSCKTLQKPRYALRGFYCKHLTPDGSQRPKVRIRNIQILPKVSWAIIEANKSFLEAKERALRRKNYRNIFQ